MTGRHDNTGQLISFPQDPPRTTSAQTRPISKSYVDGNPTRFRFRLVCLAIYVVCTVAYLGFRLTVFNNDAVVFSWVFFSAELYGFILSLLIVMIAWHRPERKILPPPQGLTVDVFIPTLNEPLDVLRRTALAAVRMDYPHTTWLLDDGNRPEVAELARQLGCRYRARTSNKGAKAGNLNNGLAAATGEFVVVFDADHVAQRNFLQRLLGYFTDPEVALVQTPQDYFNLDSFQHGRNKRNRLIWHEQSYFHYVGQSGRDYWNATTFCGCSAILRRSALDRIGGFPESTVTEDMHAAVKLQKLGFTTVFHPEPLAFGIAPVDFEGYVRQRLRWGEGNMQVCRAEGLPFSRKLTIPQNLCYFALTTNYLDSWQKAIYYATPIIVLVTQVPPIWCDPWLFLAFFAPYLLSTWFYFEEFGRGFGRMFATEAYTMARLGPGLLSTFGLFRKNIRFRLSSKQLQGKLPLGLVLPQVLIFTGSVGAVMFTLVRPLIDAPLNMPWGLTAIIAGLAVYHAFLAGWVINEAWRASRSVGSSYRHVVNLPLELTDNRGDTHLIGLDEFSIDECTFLADQDAFVDIGDRYAGRVFLPGADVNCTICVVGVSPALRKDERLVRCALEWASQDEADTVDMALHAGRWHRPIMGRREAVSTPYELLGKTGSVQGETEITDAHWIPAVHRSKGSGVTSLNLCFTARSAGDPQQFLLIVFKPLATGTRIDVTPIGQQPDFVRPFLVEEALDGVLFDEAALDAVGGQVYSLRADEEERTAELPETAKVS